MRRLIGSRAGIAKKAYGPIIVVGAPCCGVEALGAGLGLHPRFTPVLDERQVDRLVTALESMTTEVIPLLRSKVVPRLEMFGSTGRQSDSPNAAAVDDACLAALAVLTSRLDSLLHRGAWITASPKYVRYVYLLARLFPNARIIHVCRAVENAVCAMVSSARGADVSAGSAAQEWFSSTTTCLEAERAFGSHVIMRVRYEELRANPERQLRHVGTFLRELLAAECAGPLRVLGSAEARLVPPVLRSIPRAARALSRQLAVGARSRRANPGAAYRLALSFQEQARDRKPPEASWRRQVQQAVEALVPHGATVAVVSKGDDALLDLPGRCGWHFPQTKSGVYAGYYPKTSDEAIQHLEALRQKGASYLLFPPTSLWWLEHYTELKEYLETACEPVSDESHGCVVVALRPPTPGNGRPGSIRLRVGTSTSKAAQGATGTKAVLEERSLWRAFVRTDPTPPRRVPERLPGSLWALTTYYNPAGYRNKLANYRAFRKGLGKSGVRLLTMEVVFGDRPFELMGSDADRLIQLRGRDVFWQKERILNIGLTHLPSDCDKVAWLDADILFANSQWADATARLLEEYLVVQPFSHCVRLTPGVDCCDPLALPFGSDEGQLFYGIGFGIATKGPKTLGSYFEHGHTGFAWSARRWLLEKHGLYDANLLANGDTDIAHAFFAHFDYWGLQKFGPKGRTHLLRWAKKFGADVRGSVGFVEGLIFHLWHGSMQDRLYGKLVDVLHDFDPGRDITIDPESGLYTWSPKALPRLREWCGNYFAARREEGL